jgi:mannose-1-phosphate guanylyltransferase/phosphomannomutase
MIAVIIGGGQGTRIKKVFKNPKFLLKIKKKNLLERQLSLLTKLPKIRKIFLSINEKYKEKIKIKKFYKRKVSIISERKPLGTAGCLSLIKKEKFNDVLIIFADLLINFNFKEFIEFHKKRKSAATICIHPNNHPEDSDMVEITERGELIKFYKKPHKQKLFINNRCMSGIFIFNKKILNFIKNNKKSDISKNLIPKIIKKKIKIFAYHNTGLIKDIGTPKRLLEAKKLYNLRIKKKRPAIFLDRDGVLNKEAKNEKFSNPLNFYSDTINAIKLINNSLYYAIIITNQPAIAKNFITEKKIIQQHKYLEQKLGENRAYINDIFFCPHHPKKGFKNENKKFKIYCECRKPKPGMILSAQKKYNIDLKKSFFIGNNKVDILAAKAAGVQPILIRSKEKFFKIKKFKNLISAVKFIIKKKF